MAIPDRKISENFSLFEFLRSDTAERIGKHDEQFNPPADVVTNIEHLVREVLQPLHDKLNGSIIISSGYRCKSVNDAVGSKDTSQHLKGMAADCTYKVNGKADNLALYNELIISGIAFDQVIKEYGTDSAPAWIHISFDPTKPKQRMQKLRIK